MQEASSGHILSRTSLARVADMEMAPWQVHAVPRHFMFENGGFYGHDP